MPSYDTSVVTPSAVTARKAAPVTSVSYKIAHQKVSIDVDLEKRAISGYTELLVIPTEPVLKTVQLDCRQMEVLNVLVNNRRAKFSYDDPLRKEFEMFIDKDKQPLYTDIHQHHFYKNKFDKIFSGESTKELTIHMPEKLKLTLHDPSSIHTFTPAFKDSPGSHKTSTSLEAIYTPITIKVEYRLKNPKNGVNFVGGVGSGLSKSEWHAYTTNSEFDISTSSWVPCINSLWEKSTWEIEIGVPQSVKEIGNSKIIGSNFLNPKAQSKEKRDEQGEEQEDGEQGDEEDPDDSVDIIVVGGDFSNQKERAHPIDLSKKVVTFSIFNPTSAHHVGWAVGPFTQIPLINLQEEEEPELSEEKDTTAVPTAVYCMPSQKNDAVNTTIFLYKAIDFYSREFGSFPFTSYAVVFVSDIDSDSNGFAGISVLSKKLLYSPNVIEPIYPSTYKLSVALSEQWSGVNVVPISYNDLWCTLGISHFMALQFIRKLMGVNEYKYRIKIQSEKICEEDVGKPPLADPFLKFPISLHDIDFLTLKSPIVLFILDRRMTKTDKSFGLSRVIPKIFLQAMSGDLTNGALSTSHFQHICEKVNHNRLDPFFRQWVLGSGVPIFRVTQRFNKKRMFIEMGIRQVQQQETEPHHPSPKILIDEARCELETTEVMTTHPSIFTGPMTIRIHEADGTPYEHIVDLKEGFTKLDIQYNTKYKRLKRSQRQIKSEKEKADQEEEVILLHCLGDILQSESDIKEWDLTEWSKEEEDKMTNEAFEWIRIDADFEWICKIHINQPDYMYASQLQQDRDVEAQIDSIRYFSNANPSGLYSSILLRILMDSRYYYGVRTEAAYGISKLAKSRTNWIGMKHLLKGYKKLFCFPESDIPLSNDFSDFSSYFVKKAIPGALSTIQNENNDSPLEVRKFLLILLKYNENLNNPYSDAFYIGHLISCLTQSICLNPLIDKVEKLNEVDKAFLNEAVAEITRHQKLDEWISSYNSYVGVSSAKSKLTLSRHGLLELDADKLLLHTKSIYPDDIRITSFEGLFQMGGLRNKEILHYFFLSSAFENSPYMKRHLIRSFVEAFGFAVIRGTTFALDEVEINSEVENDSDASVINSNELVIIDEKAKDQFSSRKDAAQRSTLTGAINLLRRDYGSFDPLQREIWDALQHPLFSIAEKRDLFDVASVLFPAYDTLIVKFERPREKKITASRVEDTKIILKREGHFKISLSKKLANPGSAGSLSRTKSAAKPVIKLTTKPSSSAAPKIVLNSKSKQAKYKAEIKRSKSGPLRYVSISTKNRVITVSSEPKKQARSIKHENPKKKKEPAKPKVILKTKGSSEVTKSRPKVEVERTPPLPVSAGESSKPKLKLKFKF